MSYECRLVSVVVPVYNVEKYLSEMLDSLLNQDYTNLEILLIDDGSTDSSHDVCKKYAMFDKRIQVFSKENEGPSETRNFGLKKITGEFVLFLDSDDYIEPNMISSMIEIMKNDDSDICICNVKRVALEDSWIQCTENLPKLIDFDSYRRMDYILNYVISENMHKYSVWNRIYRTEILKINNIKFVRYNDIISEDMLFNLHVLKHANRISWIQDSLYKHYIRQGTLTLLPKPNIVSRARKQIDLIYDLISNTDLIDAYPYISLKIANMAIDYTIVQNKNSFCKFKKELENFEDIPYLKNFFELTRSHDYKISYEQYCIIKVINNDMQYLYVFPFYLYKKIRYSLGLAKKKIKDNLNNCWN